VLGPECTAAQPVSNVENVQKIWRAHDRPIKPAISWIGASTDMDDQLTEALRLRKEGRHEDSRMLIMELVAAHPDDAYLNYQAAWAHDLLGLEREAVPFYTRAIGLGLEDEHLAGALLGLGSTYRALGAYDDAVKTLRRGVETFPDEGALRVFLAMALYNAGKQREAMESLLRVVAESSQDPSIVGYKRAIEFYAGRLDETW
jgi:tetratricopeptide (TPR) repeat protein